MTMLAEVGPWLEDRVSVLKSGTNFFGGILPEKPDRAVAIFENTSVAPVETMGSGTGPSIERPRLQLFVRDDDYASGRSLVETIYGTLNVVSNEVMEGTLYLRIASVDMPELLDRSSNQHPIFVCNFDVWRIP